MMVRSSVRLAYILYAILGFGAFKLIVFENASTFEVLVALGFVLVTFLLITLMNVVISRFGGEVDE